MSFNMKESNGHKIFAVHENQNFKEYMRANNVKETNRHQETKSELIQGFNFNISSQKIKLSRDKDFIVVAGVYKPVLKIFDLFQQSIKCEWGTDCEIVDFQILSDDYKKLALVMQDWVVEIHDQGGRYFQTKVPRTPRVTYFNNFSSEFLVAGAGEEIYRLDLEEGVFQQPFNTKQQGVNDIIFVPQLEILLAGCQNSYLSIIDQRCSNQIIGFDTQNYADVTIVQQGTRFNELYVGSSEGLVQHFDLRSDKPIQVMQHPYMEPIKKIQLAESSSKIITADSKQIRIHDSDNFRNQLLNFELGEPLNDFLMYPDSGLMLTACESQNCGVYFLPVLGHAPKQFEYLENFTDQYLIESKEKLSDTHWFISYEELKTLDALDLIGTNKLQSCLQGYKITHQLYNKLRQKETHFDYEEYKQRQIQKEIDKKINETIFNKDQKVWINDKTYKTKEVIQSQQDSRFQRMSQNADFEIDEHISQKMKVFQGKKVRK